MAVPHLNFSKAIQMPVLLIIQAVLLRTSVRASVLHPTIASIQILPFMYDQQQKNFNYKLAVYFSPLSMTLFCF